MKQKETTLCGKTVNLAYCYATEIAFKELTDSDINDFVSEAVDAVSANRMPDIKKTICTLLASMMAYYNANNGEPPVTDKELMNEATPTEIGTALGIVLTLRMDFYKLPSGEPEEKTEKRRTRKKNS